MIAPLPCLVSEIPTAAALDPTRFISVAVLAAVETGGEMAGVRILTNSQLLRLGRSTSSNEGDVPTRKTGHRRTKRAGIAVVLALLVAAFLGQSASAASWGFNGYNSWNWYGCKINAGPVYDPHTSQGRFAVIGGGQFTACPVRHNFEVYVQEQYKAKLGGPVYNIGARAASGLFRNSYGMPAGNIAQTARLCGYTGYWRTAVDVWSNGYWSGWRYSEWHGPVTASCL